MKVLVIPTWYPSGADKLMGLYHKEFTDALNKHGIEADMLYIDRQRLSKPLKYLFMKKKDIDVEENYTVYKYRMLNVAPINFDWQIKKYTKKLERAYKDYIKKNGQPDVIHAQVTVPAGYAVCKLGKKYNIPVVVTEHCGDLERFFNRADLEKYGKFVLENAQVFSTVSNYMKKIVLKYTDECEIIPNLVDTKLFANDLNRKISKPFRLVSLCALREGKRLDIAFEAIRVLKDESLDVHLDVIGDGYFESDYKNKAQELNLNDCVTFLGRLPKKKIPQVFEKEHALLISSELESFAIPGVEALASGLPVITTDCLGPTEFVNKKTGIICKVNDVKDMARAIREMIDNYDSYKREDLVKTAESYSEEVVIPNAVKLYELAIDRINKKY